MEQSKHFLGFEHFRTDLGDGLRTGVYFDSCHGTCFDACVPNSFLKEHPFAMDTKERSFYTQSELISYLKEEKLWCHSKPLGISFLGKEPLSDASFCHGVGRAVKEMGMGLDIWTCGTVSRAAFDLLYGVADCFVFRLFSAIPCRNLPELYPLFDRILDHLFYLDQKNFPYRVQIPVIKNVNETAAGALSGLLLKLENVKSIILDFSNCSLDSDQQAEYRNAFLKHQLVLY